MTDETFGEAAPNRHHPEPPDRGYAALWSMVGYHWRPNLVSTLVRALAMVPTALFPYFLAQLVTSADDKDRAFLYLVLLLGSGVTHAALWTACDFYVSRRVVPLTYEFKRIVFKTVWDKNYRSFVDHPSGKTASYVNDIRDQVENLWDSIHFSFLPMAVSIPIYTVLLYGSAASSALLYLMFLLVAGVILTVLARPVRARRRHLTDTTATNNGRVFDSYANFVNVFSFRAHRKEVARNNREIDGLIGDSIRFNYALSGYWGVASTLVRVGLWAVVMGYSWYLYDQGRITFTAMVISITVLIDFTSEYWEVVYHYGVWVDNSAAYREAYNYLFPGRDVIDEHYRNRAEPEAEGATPSAPPATNGSKPARLNQALEVRNLSFAYPDEPDRLVLNKVSFRVAKGEKLGVVGRSGEGKSTLIKILLGFYPPTSGEILIDGVPADAELLNRIQSYVPQDTSLFQETIGYNIAYAVDHEPGAEPAVAEAARRAYIAPFIESLPEGYQTLVGERGIKLSLGQRQRIAIARAFLKPSDLLILDEATSSLDSETEAFIQSALENLWVDRAAIIIAHRLATLNNVDRILVIENGEVVEEGTKDELLAARGAFAELWSLQRSGMI
ncbi:MAG: ABC transporter ATP-binding protein/permease [Acidimicrobiia bacterium]|nr:ABC transporter ATP-binding protein/permease [Acidimicrobiia bacterium]